MVTEGETLGGVINGGADVAEGALHQAVADGAEEDPIAATDDDQGEEEEDIGPQIEPGAPFDVPAQAGDGAAQDLRQHHFDGDIDQEQPDGKRDLGRVPAQKSDDAKQIARLQSGS